MGAKIRKMNNSNRRQIVPQGGHLYEINNSKNAIQRDFLTSGLRLKEKIVNALFEKEKKYYAFS